MIGVNCCTMSPFKSKYLLFVFLLISLCFAPGSLYSQSLQNDPYQILHRYYEAIGGLQRLKTIKTAYYEGEAEYDGLSGTFRQWEENPLKYRLEEDYTVINLTTGDDGRFSWMKDTNGKVLVYRDEDTMKRRRIRKRLKNFEHLDPHSPYFSLFYEGIRKTKTGITCHVVRMTNTINSDVSLSFFDSATSLLRQSIEKQPDMEIHTVITDYRRVGDLLVAFSEDSDILPRGKRTQSRLSLYQPHIDIDPSLFHVPDDLKKDFTFQDGSKAEEIPFLFSENNIYLPVTIKGETRWWILDSGASKSVIDAGYAKELGLTQEGAITGFGFGDTFDLSFVRLPSFSVDTVRMSPQKIFVFTDFTENHGEPPAAGILGYDFLSRFVTKIDYAEKRISFYDPESFTYRGNGTIIDAPLKYRTFTAPVLVDGKLSGNWSIDLGATDTQFHFQFAEKNNLFDRQGVVTARAGMSGIFFSRIVQFDSFAIGNFCIKKPLLTFPLKKGKGSSAIGEQAGNIGNSILSHFILYLDYKKQQIVLEKGKNFNRQAPREKSGMVIGYTKEDGSPMVSFVANGTPAEVAGFVAGDIILTINKRAIQDYEGVPAVKKLLLQNAGTTLSFTVRRGPAEKEIELTLQELF